MITPDNLGAILERLKNNALTDADRAFLEQVVGNTTLQNVAQSGKYNVNFDQASSTQIGDRYGLSIEELRAIVRELQTLQPQSNPTGSKQPEQIPDNEPLAIPTISSQIVELINFRLAAIEELQKTGQLSSTQQTEFNDLKLKIHSVKEINQKLQAIANSVDRMLQEAVKTLAEKLRELDRSQEDRLLEASEHFCLKQQIELLEQFQADLSRGKFVARWLKSQQQLAQQLGQCALDAYPEIKATTSPRRLEAFYFSLEQFLERLGHCLTWGRTNSLEKPVTPVVLDDAVYVTAFEQLKTLIPDHLPDDGIEQLKEYIDYLVKRLPNYSHVFTD
jgi:DNA-directed RNA polymerase specialized sigma24 family protein